MITKDTIRCRFKQIQEARETIRNAKFSTSRWLGAEEFMKKIRKSSMASDSHNAALKGFVDIDDGLNYICPIEDFSKEQLSKINKMRGLEQIQCG